MSSNRPKDRSSLCTFSYSDGRKCATPRGNHLYLCAFHARKESQIRANEELARGISRHLSGDCLSASGLASALSRLFAAVAQGHVKPKDAANLCYLGQTLSHLVPLAQNEFINAFGAESWRKSIRAALANSSGNPASPAPPKQLPPPPLPTEKSGFATHLESTLTKVYENKSLDPL